MMWLFIRIRIEIKSNPLNGPQVGTVTTTKPDRPVKSPHPVRKSSNGIWWKSVAIFY